VLKRSGASRAVGGAGAERSVARIHVWSQAPSGGGSLRICQRRQPEQQRAQSHAAIKWGAGSRCSDVWLAGSSREPWLGGDGAGRRRTAEHGQPKVRRKWERTSGTSCAVVCHAESERCLCLLDGRGMVNRFSACGSRLELQLDHHKAVWRDLEIHFGTRRTTRQRSTAANGRAGGVKLKAGGSSQGNAVF
jgi:hypothetical protein